MKNFLDNYKTSLIGVILIVVIIIGFWIKKLTPEEAMIIMSIITGIGFFHTKDADNK